MKQVSTIDAYIAGFDGEVKEKLIQFREIIRKAAPRAEETIKYGIPTFVFEGNLVHFGGFKNHVSLFPASSGVKAFAEELKPYSISKGTIQFPLGKPLPKTLISKIVKFRVNENSLRKALKNK